MHTFHKTMQLRTNNFMLGYPDPLITVVQRCCILIQPVVFSASAMQVCLIPICFVVYWLKLVQLWGVLQRNECGRYAKSTICIMLLLSIQDAGCR